MDDELVEPLDPDEAKPLIRKILTEGMVSIPSHAKGRLASREMETSDALNVLRAGFVEHPDLEGGTYRYRVCTQRMTVVIAFRSKTHLVIITAWRNP